MIQPEAYPKFNNQPLFPQHVESPITSQKLWIQIHCANLLEIGITFLRTVRSWFCHLLPSKISCSQTSIHAGIHFPKLVSHCSIPWCVSPFCLFLCVSHTAYSSNLFTDKVVEMQLYRRCISIKFFQMPSIKIPIAA